MTQEELVQMLDRAVREVTQEAAGIELFASGRELEGDVCTIHVTFNKGFHTSLSLCAEMALMERMARQVFGDDMRGPQDVEDFAKEYVNILCGKIAAALFRITQIGASFSVPEFHHGRYTPKDSQPQFMLTYTDGQQGGTQIVHHIPLPFFNTGIGVKPAASGEKKETELSET